MKILYITTIGATMDFFRDVVSKAIGQGHQVDIACNESQRPVQEIFRQWGCGVYPLSCSRSLLDRGNLTAVGQVRRLVRDGGYDLVHCHTPIAAICARLGCRQDRRKGLKVIYTAHGFHFYHGAPLKNWLLFYPAEKLCAHWTDVLVTINREDHHLARKKLKAGQVRYVPGVGVDTAYFAQVQVGRAEKRRSLGIPAEGFLVLSVGEINENKNQQAVIRALAQCSDLSIHYALVGRGDRRPLLEQLVRDLGLEGRVHFLGYRQDVASLYHCADCFIHPSFREGLPVALMEAMASGLPAIASKIRGAVDLIEPGVSGLLCDPADPASFAQAITELAADPEKCRRFRDNARKKVAGFDVSVVTATMLELYGSIQERHKED